MGEQTCDLCGLSTRHGAITEKQSGRTLHFCCFGCKQVYTLLAEAFEPSEPSNFRESEIFKRCLEAGIIPRSQDDLEKRISQPTAQGGADSRSIQADPGHENAVGLKLDLGVEGMWCPACAWVIEESLQKMDGVHQVACHFTMDRLELEYNPVYTSPQQIEDNIRKLGYDSHLWEDEQHRRQTRSGFIRLAVSVFFTMNVMMLSFALYTGFFTQLSATAIHSLTWPIAVMGSIVYVYGGAPIHRRALSGFWLKSPGMEALISLGASSAYAYSLYNWMTGSIHIYFDTASMLITLVLLGKAIEQRAKDKINAQIGSFFDLQPKKVRICTDQFPDGKYVRADALNRGDVFRVTAGEAVPADGRVVEGEGRVDESSLTGEARPVHMRVGDPISSGTKVIAGSLKAKVLSVGPDSIIGQLVAVLDAALNEKSEIEDITDRALRFFVPLIVLLALLTGVVCLILGLGGQHAVIRAVTVMVISCPCALGVAIPLARVAAISLAGKKGVLVHRFEAFEKIRSIDTFIFDKTGTLTRGEWALSKTIPLKPWRTEVLLSLAAGLEKDSMHYAGAAIVQAAREMRIAPSAVSNITERSNGVSGYAGESPVKIGSAAFLAREISAARDAFGDGALPSAPAMSHVYMAVDGRLSAIFQFGDSVRGSSMKVIDALKKRKIKVALISGDGNNTTRQVGGLLGIDECHGSMLPPDKAEFVRSARRQGLNVAMVGDGVNDVPALAAANIGIAVHAGHRIGTKASGITLMGNDPKQILIFEQLADQVSRTIRQNLVFTFFYNAISIPIAMSGLLNPLVAVSAMLMSSLSVTGNTLYLTRRVSRSEYNSGD